jgi:hypothetical protein
MPPGAVSQLTSTWDTRGWVSQMHALYTTSASACAGTVHVHGSSMSSVGSPRPILLHTTVQSQSLALECTAGNCQASCSAVFADRMHACHGPNLAEAQLPISDAQGAACTTCRQACTWCSGQIYAMACVHQRRRAFACHNLRTELAVIGAGVAQHTV